LTTAQACVRGLLLAALLPEAPRWGQGVARFSPRFTDRLPASTVGETRFVDPPQRWGVAPHVEHQVVEGGLSPPFPSPAIPQRNGRLPVHDFGRTCRTRWVGRCRVASGQAGTFASAPLR